MKKHDEKGSPTTTMLRQGWREKASDAIRVSLHVDEWQRTYFADAYPELVAAGAPEAVVLDEVVAARVRKSHLGVWESD